MIYLDTHVVVWLFAGLIDKFHQSGLDLINRNDVLISPIVRLELQYLYEGRRVLEVPDVIVGDLARRIGLQIDDKPFGDIVSRTLDYSWTRDPFDRLIVGHAAVDDDLLLSKDRKILENYPFARW